MIVLGLESSCDETGAAIVRDGELQSNIVASQGEHSLYGGVVPEVASRLHEEKIVGIVRAAIAAAGVDLSDLDAVCATNGPGLAGALAVGLNFGKGLSQALNIPLVTVNHMEGHLWSNFLVEGVASAEFPFLCLLVSGGHTHIWEVKDWGAYYLLGRTLDDAAGEAFDKGARLLGLGYPGGPEIERAARGGNPKFYHFPRPLAGSKSCDFSFSGLKTALYYYLKKADGAVLESNLKDVSAAYQQAIIDCLLDRLQIAVERTGIRTVAVAGGVSANDSFRQTLDNWARSDQIRLRYPPLEFCTDNAAMIGLAGYVRLLRGQTSDYAAKIAPNLTLERV